MRSHRAFVPCIARRGSLPQWLALGLLLLCAAEATAQTPPAPTPASATAVSSSQIDLQWTMPSGYTNFLIKRCTGSGCTGWIPIASPINTNVYSNTGLSASTLYRYEIFTLDGEGTPGGVAILQATTLASGGGDTQAPTAPSGLSATAVSSSQIDLSWTASTDNVAVTGYSVERCQGAGCTSFAQIATPTSTTYSDTGRTGSTVYRYQVRARDAIPNWSAYSSIASATTPAAPDTQAPTAPTALTATAVSTTQVNLGWTASTDNVAVTGYSVERCQGASCTTFAAIATPTTNSYSDTGRSASTTYRYQVRARDAVPNWSLYSNIQTVTTPAAGDTQAPTTPTGFTATPGVGQVVLSWIASTDNVGVVEYRVERCQGLGCSSFTDIAGAATTSYTDTTVMLGQSYTYRVRARDAVPNYSSYSINGTTKPKICN